MSHRLRRAPARLAYLFLVAMAAAGSASCATVFQGRTQRLAVTSDPAGANVYLGSDLVGVTPTELTVSRRRTGLTLRVEKGGYEPATVVLERRVSPWILADVAWSAAQFGNQGLRSRSDAPKAAAAVAALSLGIDFATGSAYRLTPARVRVTLMPVACGPDFTRGSTSARGLEALTSRR